MVFAAKTRGERILEAGAPFPQHAALTLQCSRDGTSVQNFEKLLLEAIAREHGRSLPPDNRRAHRAEALADWLALKILGDLPIADAAEKVRRIRNAEAAGSEVDVPRHGVLRGVALAVAPAGTADISYRAFAGGSDYPKLVQDALQLLLVAAFGEEEKPWQAISRVIPAKDFKTHHALKADVPAFQATPNGVPVPIGAAAEADQPFQLTTYAQAIDLGRQLLANDEVGALQAAAEGVARAAAVTIGNVVFTSLQANPELGDGEDLFSTAHANTAGSLSLDAAGLAATMARVRNQVSLSGERMNLKPDHLLIAPGAEATARVLLGSFGENGSDIKLLIEPRLSVTTTYFCIASGAPGLAIAALDGRLEPSIQQRIPMQPYGTRFLVAIDFAPVWLDYRSWARATA
jgi:hypothetical protein